MRPELLAHWNTVSKLLDEALELDPEARASWLAALPAEFAAVKPMLEELFARSSGNTRGFLGEDLPRYDSTGVVGAGRPRHETGEEIGGFRLIRELGHGGMGTVWLADRIGGGSGIRVALKLPHLEGAAALPASNIRERFEREREILAALNHANIARLLEAGVTAEGQPYLALEYVEGTTLLDHCNGKALPLRERLKLFLQVLKAVEYAHAHLVIHRDLKPSNILVTPTHDVKLLDFGIAKLLAVDAARTVETALTQRVGHVMTPDYASPEQVSGVPLTTASDVYSLGVLLYELLTGAQPYRLKRGTRAELEEAILSADTSLPSTAVSEALATRMKVSGARWRRELRGDLDTITLEALRKDPALRYPGVDAFRQDIERYLDGRPVLARPESAWYRFGKLVARNKLAVGAASVVAVALLAGTLVSLWQARVAVREAGKARAVQGFLTELFEKNTRLQADAAKARSKTVREVLVEASDRVGDSFADAPELRAELSVMLARLLADVDEFERAARLSRAALVLMRTQGLTGSDLEVEALIALTHASRLLGNAKDALEARDAALAVLDARGDRTSLLRARVSASSLMFLSRDLDRETLLAREALALFDQRYPEHPERFAATVVLGQLHRSQGEWIAAERYFRAGIELFPKVKSRDHVNFAAAHTWAGFCAARRGRSAEALRDYEAGIPLLRASAGENALVTRFHRGMQAVVLHRSGYVAEAHRAWDELRQTATSGKPSVVDFDNAIYEADALVREGRPGLAVERLNAFSPQHVEMGKRFYPNGVRWATLLALAHAMQGHDKEAAAALKRVDDLPQQYPIPPRQLVDYKIDVTWILLSAGRVDEAGTLLRFGEDHTTSEGKTFQEGFVTTNLRAADAAVLQGDAAAARMHAQRALDHLARNLAPGSLPWLEAEALRAQGNARLASEDAAGALKSLEPAIAAMRRLQDPSSPWLADALVSVALAHRGLGHREQAAPLLAEARQIVRRNPSLSPAFTDRLRRAG